MTRSVAKKSTPTKHAPMASEGPHSRESSRLLERTKLSKASRKQGIRNDVMFDMRVVSYEAAKEIGDSFL